MTPEKGPRNGAGERRQTRDRNRPLQVYVTPAERNILEANAQRAGMRMSHYLRTVGAGAQLRSVVDLEAIGSLARISADQGRLGGLLKMYLQDRNPDRRTAERLLTDIEDAQTEIRAAMKRIMP